MTGKDEQVALTRGSVATLAALAAIVLGIHTAIVVPMIRGVATEIAAAKIEKHESLSSHHGAVPREEISAELRDLRERIVNNSRQLAAIKVIVDRLENQ